MRNVDVSMATSIDSDRSDDDNDRLPLASSGMGPSTAEAVVAIQSFVRASIARRRFLKLRKGVIRIQAYIRGFIVRCKFTKMRQSANVIQTRYKGYKKTKEERTNFIQFQKASRVIQNEWRRWKQRNGIEYTI